MADPGNPLRAPLTAAELMRFLPHRPPFFFLRRLVAWTPGASAVSEVEFDGREEFFRGHFPGNPIVPGVILVEAAAQTGGFALAGSLDGSLPDGRMPALAKIRGMRFRAPARPHELLHVEARVASRFGAGGAVEVLVRRGDTRLAEGDLLLALGAPPRSELD